MRVVETGHDAPVLRVDDARVLAAPRGDAIGGPNVGDAIRDDGNRGCFRLSRVARPDARVNDDQIRGKARRVRARRSDARHDDGGGERGAVQPDGRRRGHRGANYSVRMAASSFVTRPSS